MTPTVDACPVALQQIDAHVVRAGAAIVGGLTLMALAFDQPWLPLLLALDLGVRLFAGARFSPVAVAIMRLKRVIGLKPRFVDIAPKRFACALSMSMNVAVGALLWVGYPTAATSVGVMLIACCALDVGFDFCLGCWLYELGLRVRRASR